MFAHSVPTQSNSRRLGYNYSDSRRRGGRRRNRNGRGSNTIGKSIDRRVGVYQRAGVQALRDLNFLRTRINTELHNIDAATLGANSTTTAAFLLLNGCQVGDTVATRTGQSIKMDRTDVRFFINADGTSIQNIIRVMIVLDKDAKGTIFAAGDILTATVPTANLTVGSQMRFVILYDEIFALSANGNGCTSVCTKLGTNQHVMYNTGNAGTIADINNNSLYLMHFSNQLANPPIISFESRCWFIDN